MSWLQICSGQVAISLIVGRTSRVIRPPLILGQYEEVFWGNDGTVFVSFQSGLNSLLADVKFAVPKNQMVRIDYIFVHRYNRPPICEGFKATPIDAYNQSATEDSVLGSGYWHLRLTTPPEETIPLYGLPAIPCSYFQ